MNDLVRPELSAGNGFAGGRLLRDSENRDEADLDRALKDGRARFYLFDEDRALIDTARSPPEPLFDRESAVRSGLLDETVVLLGTRDGSPRLAAMARHAEGSAIKAIDLRSLAVQGVVSGKHLGALALARSLLHWHATHGFCPRCGASSRPRQGGFRRDCTGCGAQHFPRTDPVAIMLAVRGDHCLLGRQARFPAGIYSCLAGFIEPGETIEDAVRRETFEESGVRIGAVRYLSSQPWPFPSSLMIGCHAEALSDTITRDEAELEDCRWFSRDEAAQLLAGRHPAGLSAPPPIAIAHQLLQTFVDGR